MYLVTKDQYEYFKEVVGGQETFLPGGVESLKLAGEKVCKQPYLDEAVKDVRELGMDWQAWKRASVGGTGLEMPLSKTIEAITNSPRRGRRR